MTKPRAFDYLLSVGLVVSVIGLGSARLGSARLGFGSARLGILISEPANVSLGDVNQGNFCRLWIHDSE